VLERQLSVALDTTFTRPTFTAGGSDARVGGPFTYEVAEREFKFALDALYRMPVGPVGAFFGGGPVLQLLNTTQTTSFGPGENTESNVELGFELAGGADYRLGPGFLFGDLRLVFTDLDHQLTGDTNAGKITVAAGYRFVF
ncbi:MAG: outer membrane beta-barrel protein, partial [Myxococcales bacterium]